MRIKFLPTKETLFPVEMGITRGHLANGTIEPEKDAFECNFRTKTTSERLYDSVVGRSKIKLFAIGKKTWKSAANELCCDLGYFRQSSNLSIDLNRVSTSAVSSAVSFQSLRRTSFDDRTAQANGTVLKTEDDDEARKKKKKKQGQRRSFRLDDTIVDGCFSCSHLLSSVDRMDVYGRRDRRVSKEFSVVRSSLDSRPMRSTVISNRDGRIQSGRHAIPSTSWKQKQLSRSRKNLPVVRSSTPSIGHARYRVIIQQ